MDHSSQQGDTGGPLCAHTKIFNPEYYDQIFSK